MLKSLRVFFAYFLFCYLLFVGGLASAEEVGNLPTDTQVRDRDIYCENLSQKETYQKSDYKNFNQLIMAKNGWMFRTQLDLKDRFFITDRTKHHLRRLSDALDHHDTEIVMAMIPTRGMTSYEKLLPPWNDEFDLDAAISNYEEFLDNLNSTGIDVVRLDDVKTYDNFFYPRDNHWTPSGARSMAAHVAEKIKTLDFYEDTPKKTFETKVVKATRHADWPNQYETVADQICGREPRETTITQYYETEEVSSVDNLSEESLFGDSDLPEVVLLGTSNSTYIEPSYSNFDGFLKELTNLDIINEAISGGSLEGSILNYFLEGRFHKQKPKALIWEVAAYYGYNREDFYRELIPSIFGVCSADEVIKTVDLNIPAGGEELILFSELENLNIMDHSGYIALEFSDKTIRDVYVHFIHADDMKDSLRLERDNRSFPNPNGLYFAETSDVLGTPLHKISIEVKEATGSVKARFCKKPEGVLRKTQNNAEKQPAKKSHDVFEEQKDFEYEIKSVETNKTEKPFIALPSLDKYNLDEVKRKIPPLRDGDVQIKKMQGSPPLRKFVFEKRLVEMRNIQDSFEPQAIHIISGVYDFEALQKKMEELDVLEETDQGYLFKMPIAIYPEATLIIENVEKPILLSQDTGSFIAVNGDFFFINSEVTAWNEAERKPALLNETMENFRPFIVTWSGSEIYMVDSTINNLGYAAAKSYGITLSSNPIVEEKFFEAYGKLARPTGWLIGNEFNNMYFGFYSYEADDVVIYDNKYIDNLIYGIDPHDWSERLIIANNYVSGAKEKHGIIISREVNNSFIFNNVSENNKGSGFMLDRISKNNIVANNIARFNGGDGITLYESPNNILINNTIRENEGTGIRVRNSWDIDVIGGEIVLNKAQAFKIYKDDLLHTDRNFKKDPVVERAEVRFKDVNAESNNGLVKTEGFDKIIFENMNWKKGSLTSRNFYGDLEKSEKDLNKFILEEQNFILTEQK